MASGIAKQPSEAYPGQCRVLAYYQPKKLVARWRVFARARSERGVLVNLGDGNLTGWDLADEVAAIS